VEIHLPKAPHPGQEEKAHENPAPGEDAIPCPYRGKSQKRKAGPHGQREKQAPEKSGCKFLQVMHGILVGHHEIAGFPHGNKSTVKAGIGQINMQSSYNLGHKQPGKNCSKYVHFRQPFIPPAF
jgi:hypothetical protein